VLPLAFAARPSIVYDIIRRRLGEIIPLNKLLGIEIISIGDGVAEARLAFRPELTNHIGSVHATAIFGLAEAASGYAMSGAFAPVILKIRPVAANANVSFSKIARTDLIAHARTVESPEELRAKLAAAGRVVFDVVVNVHDAAGLAVGQVTVAWHVARK
jgi:uncharacterized protein (TIGR00369 family)